MVRTLFFSGVIFVAIFFGSSVNKTDAYRADPWKLNKPSFDHQIEGYADKVSVVPGADIGFHVSCLGGVYEMAIYRAGYYNGAGRSLFYRSGFNNCYRRPLPVPSKKTGLAEPQWPISKNFTLPSNWPAGMYFAEITGVDGYQSYVPFLVRSIKPQNRFLFVHAVNTDNAYNSWGGNSLYKGEAPELNLKRAVKVTFDRPFGDDGAGLFFRWEFSMIEFMEKYGYGVDYATDVDIDKSPDLLAKYPVVVLAGHNEYWSLPMREGYINAVRHGTNLAVFGANTAFRAVRYEDGGKVMVDYKRASADPIKTISGNKIPTPQGWRDKPLYRPESEIMGLSWGGENEDSNQPADMVVASHDSWMLNGTGLEPGDRLPKLVGYEYDKYQLFAPKPAPVDIIFHSPLVNSEGEKDYADAGLFTVSGGGSVFDAGTILWSSGLDESSENYSPQLVKITRNMLDHFSSQLEVTGLKVKP